LVLTSNSSTYPSSPGAREPTFVAILFELTRRKKEQGCKRQLLVMVRQRWARW
jgi:hypothetical protein